MIEKHVAARDVDYITAPFMEKTETKRWWQTEFWGKWMHSAMPYLASAFQILAASEIRGTLLGVQILILWVWVGPETTVYLSWTTLGVARLY